MKEVVNRMNSRTPRFFRILRNVGIAIAAAAGAVLASPVVLPAAVVTAAGYALVGGTVLGAVSQAVKEDNSGAATESDE